MSKKTIGASYAEVRASKNLSIHNPTSLGSSSNHIKPASSASSATSGSFNLIKSRNDFSSASIKGDHSRGAQFSLEDKENSVGIHQLVKIKGQKREETSNVFVKKSGNVNVSHTKNIQTNQIIPQKQLKQQQHQHIRQQSPLQQKSINIADLLSWNKAQEQLQALSIGVQSAPASKSPLRLNLTPNRDVSQDQRDILENTLVTVRILEKQLEKERRLRAKENEITRDLHRQIEEQTNESTNIINSFRNRNMKISEVILHLINIIGIIQQRIKNRKSNAKTLLQQISNNLDPLLSCLHPLMSELLKEGNQIIDQENQMDESIQYQNIYAVSCSNFGNQQQEVSQHIKMIPLSPSYQRKAIIEHDQMKKIKQQFNQNENHVNKSQTMKLNKKVSNYVDNNNNIPSNKVGQVNPQQEIHIDDLTFRERPDELIAQRLSPFNEDCNNVILIEENNAKTSIQERTGTFSISEISEEKSQKQIFTKTEDEEEKIILQGDQLLNDTLKGLGDMLRDLRNEELQDIYGDDDDILEQSVSSYKSDFQIDSRKQIKQQQLAGAEDRRRKRSVSKNY